MTLATVRTDAHVEAAVGAAGTLRNAGGAYCSTQHAGRQSRRLPLEITKGALVSRSSDIRTEEPARHPSRSTRLPGYPPRRPSMMAAAATAATTEQPAPQSKQPAAAASTGRPLVAGRHRSSRPSSRPARIILRPRAQ